MSLVGPHGARLWAIETDLYKLSVERQSLIDTLRATASGGPVPPPRADPWSTVPPPNTEWLPEAPPGGWAPPPTVPAPAFAAGQVSEFGGDPSSPPLQVQTVLLTLGAFSLIVAAVVFLAVTWGGLSAAGKTATLVSLTAVFVGITILLRRRSLTATAEALAVVTLMLGLADAYAVRVGLFPRSDRLLVWSVAFAVLALASAAFASWSRTVGPSIAALVLTQLSAPVLAAHRSSWEVLLFAVLLVQALAVVAVLRRRGTETDRLVTGVLTAGGGLAWIIAVGGATAVALFHPSQRPVGAGLLAGAGIVAAVVAWCWREDDDVSIVGAGVAAAAFLAAAPTLGSRWLDGNSLAMATVAVAVLAAIAAARVDRRWALGPLAVAGTVAIGASSPSWPAIGDALRAPWSGASPLQTWGVGATRSLRVVEDVSLVSSDVRPALGSLAILAIGVLGVRKRLRRTPTDWLLAALAGVAAATVPFAVNGTVWSAAVILLAVGVAGAALVLWRSAAGETSADRAPWWALVGGAGVQGLGWALMSPGLTLVALVVFATTAAAVAVAGLRRADRRMAEVGALVMSLAVAVSVPVAAHVVGVSPEIGWTALAVLAAAVAAVAFVAWSDPNRAVPSTAPIVGGVAAAAYAIGAAGAGSLVNRAGGAGRLAAIFAAGSVAALIMTIVAVRRRLETVPGMSALAGTVLALAVVGLIAVQSGLPMPAAWLAVTVAAAAASLGAFLAETLAVHEEVVDAIDIAAGLGGAAGLAALVSLGSASRISLGLLVVTVALGVQALRPRRRAAAWGAALGALVLLWQRLALAGVTTAEAFTLPAAALLAAAGVWRHRRAPEEPSWNTWGPALVVALGPSVVLALRDPGLLRPISTVVAAAAVTLVGARLRRRAPVMIGAAALVVLGIQQLGPFVRQLPRWLTFAAVGMILLLVGASYERRRTQLAGLRQHYRRMH